VLGPCSKSRKLEHALMMLALDELVIAVTAYIAIYIVPYDIVANFYHIPAVYDFFADYAVSHIVSPFPFFQENG